MFFRLESPGTGSACQLAPTNRIEQQLPRKALRNRSRLLHIIYMGSWNEGRTGHRRLGARQAGCLGAGQQGRLEAFWREPRLALRHEHQLRESACQRSV